MQILWSPENEGAGGGSSQTPASVTPSATSQATPTPTEAAPSPTPVENSHGVDPEIESILRFDPFKEAMKQEGEKPATPETKPETPVPPTEVKPVIPAAPVQSPEVQALQAKVDALQALVASGVNPAQAQPQAVDDPFKDVPAYPLQVPDDLFNAMNAEDLGTRRQALNALLSVQARVVHAMVVRDMSQRFARDLPQQIETVMGARLEQKQVFDDFYTRHADLNNPALYPVVTQVAAQIMKQTGATKYSPQLGDQIAAATKQLIAQFNVQRPQPQPQPTPTAIPAGVRPQPQRDQNPLDMLL